MTLPHPLTAGDRHPKTVRQIALELLELEELATFPSSPRNGQLANVLGVAYVYSGNAWVDLGGGSFPSHLDTVAYKGLDIFTPTPELQPLAVINSDLQTIADRLTAIEVGPFTLDSFGVSPSQAEVGDTIANLVFTWTRSGASPISASISNGIGSVSPPTALTKTATGVNITTTQSYVLTISDGTSSPTRSTSATFKLRRMWGVSATDTASQGLLAGLSSELSTSRAQSRTFNTSAQYIWFGWPASYGTPTFYVNGFLNTAWIKSTIVYTNGFGHAENYDCYRSQYLQNGSGIQVTVS